MPIQLGSAYGKVELDSSGLKRGVSTAIGDLKNLQSSSAGLGASLLKVGQSLASLGIAFAASNFLKSSIHSAMESENALAELNAVLKSTQGVAGLTTDELVKMASGLQKVTKFSDEEIILGQSMLLTFTKIGKEVFPQTTEAMLNLAEKFGGVDQAAIQLGKAMNDPIEGVTALRRVGVGLTNQQEDQIKAFMAVNDVASAQKVILSELEVKFGGLAKAVGDTTEGKIIQFQNALDDLKESIGDAFIPTLVKLMEALTKLMEFFVALPQPVKDAGVAIIALVAVSGKLVGVIKFFEALKGLGIGLPALGTAFSAASTTMAGALSSMGTAFASLGAVITGTVLPAIGSFLVAAAPIIIAILLVAGAIALLYWAFKTNFMGITTAAKQLWFIIQYGFAKLWEALKTGVTEALGAIQESWNKWIEDNQAKFTAWREWIQSAWQRVLDYFARVRDYIVNIFRQVDWANVGKAIVLGLANGMLLGIPNLVMTAIKVAQSVLTAMNKTLLIKSPSAAMFKIGVQTAQGYLLGMKGMMDANAIAGALARPVLNSNSSNQMVVNNNFASGLTISQAQEMIDANNDRLFGRLVDAFANINL